MVKNTAGQKIGAQMVSATDGSAFTGSVTVAVTLDAGTQATGTVGSGACTHEGNGYHTYAPAQAETNGTLLAFTFTGTGAVPSTVQVFTTGFDPTAAVVPANTTQFAGSAITSAAGIPEVKVASLAANAITATAIAADAITDAKVAADVTIASVTGAVGSVTGNVGGNVTGSVGSVAAGGITASSIAADAIGASELAADAVAEIADAVWDEVLSGHLTAGTTGAGLNSAGSAGDPWSTAVPGAYGAGTAGKILGDNLNATVSSRLASASYTAPLDASGTRSAVGLASANLDTQIAAVKTDTANIYSAIDTEVAAILAAVDTEVAQIVTLLNSARTEPGQGAPPVNPSAVQKLDYLYKAFRNKVTQTATTLSIYADDGTTVDHKATVSDDATTYTRSELATGP